MRNAFEGLIRRLACIGNSGGEKKDKNRRNIRSKNDWEFSKINDRHQTIDPGGSENTKNAKYWKIYTYAYHIQTAEYQRRETILKVAREENTLPIEEQE